MTKKDFWKRDLKKFLENLDFKYYPSNPNIKNHYYVNKNGNQVKLNYKSNIITLLDKYGDIVDSSHSFNENELREFIERYN